MKVFTHIEYKWDYVIEAREDGTLWFVFNDSTRHNEPVTTFDLAVCENCVMNGKWKVEIIE